MGLDYQTDGPQVEVVDDGRGPEGTRTGHGLVGMRERTTLLGGRFQAGPRASGGYRVRATIPYEPVV